MQENIKQITKANVEVLFELRQKMCGVINNRHNKSKGFQFALLHRNIDEAIAQIYHNSKRF